MIITSLPEYTSKTVEVRQETIVRRYSPERDKPHAPRFSNLQFPSFRIWRWSAPKLPVAVTRVFRNWWEELLAAALFIFAFSTLVALLCAYQGQPAPQWPLNFTFNTALSVLGAIFRAPALFIVAEGLGQLKWQWLSAKHRPISDLTAYDDATRGPWGATKLLLTARWRDLLAFLGALLTVVSLAIDPFTQAVVSYYPCTTILTTAYPTMSQINSFFSDGMLGWSVPPWAEQAFDASFYNPASITPNFTCATESCKFGELYHSIGLCVTCGDVTHEVQTECTDDPENGNCNYTLS